MGVRALPRNNERLIWRTPKEPRERERGTAWQFHLKLPLAFVELRLVLVTAASFTSSRISGIFLQAHESTYFDNRLLIGTNF